jgi:hypothetical protein
LSKEKFWEIYDRYITRDGSKDLKEWILSTDFETAPASTRFHGSYEGGLIEHSVHVWEELVRLLKAYPEIQTNGETVAIIALLHDCCKLNFYAQELRNVKVGNTWTKQPFYTVKEEFAFGGHGSKSVFLIQQFMKLTSEEAVAVNNHMGSWDRSPSDYGVGNAFEAYPLAWLLHVADESATYIRESNR